MGTYSSVACAEVHGSKSVTGDIFSGMQASVQLQCAWGDHLALIDDLLNTPRGYPDTIGLTPYAVRATAVPMLDQPSGSVASGQECIYDQAIVSVEYNTTITDVAAETIEPNMEAIPLDYRSFNFGGIGGRLLLEGEAPPLILRSFNLCRTRFRLSVIPTDVLDAIGCTNQYAYTSALLGLTFAPDTLLFLPAPASRSFTNLTSSGFTLSLKFGFKPQGWNKYWDAMSQTWASIYLNNSASPYLSYPAYDFSALFA